MRARAISPLLAVTFIVGLGLVVSACMERPLTPLNPCTRSGVVEKVRVTSVDKVDLLFMVDNSNSMAEEQGSLAMQFPNLIRILASGDKDGDGIEDFPPVRSLNVAVITSDMGTGGFRVPTCTEPNFGDDGVLRTIGNTSIPGCRATNPTFLSFNPMTDNADTFAAEVSCVAVTGTGGCGFEQQLEATLKAVTPSTQPAVGRFDGTFNMGTTGHADVANAGFLRPDSLLAIIEVTDEEDCSALDPELFNPSSSVYNGDLNLRCFSFPGAVQPVGRYVDGILATRTSPDLLVYALIAGVPTDAVTPARSYEEILGHPDMVEMIDPDNPTRLRTSCNVAGRGFAFPPRRLVEVARQLDASGAAGIVQSICQADFSPAIDAIIDKIADVLGGACLPRELNPAEDGMVNCDVIETLPTEGEFTRCEQIPGREFVGTDSDTGSQICRVAQFAATGGVAPTDAGWYYDNFSPDVLSRCGDTATDGQRISYTGGNEPRTGTLVRLECLQPVQGAGGSAVIVPDSPCSPGTDSTCTNAQNIGDAICTLPSGVEGGTLTCDGETRTWQVQCASDADCQAGFRCVTGRDPFPSVCTNPTC